MLVSDLQCAVLAKRSLIEELAAVLTHLHLVLSDVISKTLLSTGPLR